MLKTEHKIAIVVGLLLVGGAVVFTVDQARKSPKKVSEVTQFDGPGVGGTPAARPGTPAPRPPSNTPVGAGGPRDAASRLDRPAPVKPDTGGAAPPPPPSGAAITRPAAENMPPLDLAAVLREKTGLTGSRVQTPGAPPGPEAILPAAGGSGPTPGDGGSERAAAAGGSAERPPAPVGGAPLPGADTGGRPDAAPPKSPPPKPSLPAGGAPPTDGRPVAGGRTHVVEEGDSLWALAEQYYGDGKYYLKIAEANKLANPDVLTAGTELVIPPRDEPAPRPGPERPRGEPRVGDTKGAPPDNGKASGEVVKPAAGARSATDAASPDTTTKPPPKDVSAKAPAGTKPADARGAANNGAKAPAKDKAAGDAKVKSATPANGRDPNGGAATRAESAPADKDKPAAAGKPKPRRTHIVAKGETLRTIARTELKNEDLWRKIYELNKSRIKNPNVLPVGLVLVLPEP